MRRDDALLTVAGLSVSAFLVLAGPAAIAVADPGGSHGNGGNSKSGSGQGGASRGNSGNSGNVNSANGNSGNGGSGPGGNSGGNASVSGQTNTGKSSKANGNGNGRGNGNGNGNGNNVASGAGSNNGSDRPAAAPTLVRPNPPMSVVVAEHHTGTTRGGGAWWPAADVAAPAIEVHAPPASSADGVADLLSADQPGIPVWVAAEPVGMRGDLFGLAGLVLMPIVGLVVGYRQAKAARDVNLTIGP